MSAHKGAVDHPVLPISVIGTMVQHSLPDARFTPPHEALVDAIPIPLLGRQQAPLRSTPAHPLDGFHTTPTFVFIPNVGIWVFSPVVP